MKARTAIVSVIAVVLGLLLFVGVAKATDSSSFCPTCHEMGPFYDSWAESPMGQQGVDCVDCHVGPGTVPRLLHKFVALKEAFSYIIQDNKFPRATPAVVPNERCEYCHDKVEEPALTGFSHADHSERESCQTCHATSGHNVTIEMMDAAGILDPNYVSAESPGAANQLPGHTAVVCTNCHDMSKRACTDCHSAPADHFGPDCLACHTPASSFASAISVSIHTGEVACITCHSKPNGHPSTGEECQSCHAAGKSWSFNHARVPGGEEHTYRSFSCETCHPNGFTSYSCLECHDSNNGGDD